MEKITALTAKQQRAVLKRLLSYTKPHIKMILFAFGLLLLTTIGDVTGPILVKIFIDEYLTVGDFLF